MTPEEAITLLPLFVLAGLSVILLLLIAFHRSHKLTFALTLAGLAAAFGVIFKSQSQTPQDVSPLLRIDSYTLFYTGLIVASALMVVLLSYPYLNRRDTRQTAIPRFDRPEEFYL
ncbi:MAG TPA: NADH-quinone oxidoreductase subunit N, partial [Armatimonadota bacterium]|nr:NADH-quinone oxidoreductase subunit N [Armatimonadota bacterium]